MNMNLQAVSCLILAGGKSRRMNHADKGLIEYRGRPLISHVISALQHQVDDFVISANRNLESYQQLASTVIPDDGEKNGPLSGIVAALPACRHELVLVVPCDMPNLPNRLVQTMLAGLADSDIAIIEVNHRLQLVILMRKSLLTSAQDHLSTGRHKLMQWVTSCTPAIIDYSDAADAFININTAEELE